MRNARMSLACFDAPMDTVDLMSLPPLPDTPPSRTSILAVDAEQQQSTQEAGSYEKLVDIVTPMPLQRTLQRNTPRSDHHPIEGLPLVEQSKVSMKDGLEQRKLGPVEPLRILAEGDERVKTITPRPIRTIARESKTDSSAPADTRSSSSSKSTDSTHTDRSPRRPEPSCRGISHALVNMTTKITGLDDSTTTDLMSDDMSFLRAMRSPSDTLSGSPPSQRISPSPSDPVDRVPSVTDANDMTPRKQAFSVLAGMAAFEASHATRGGSTAAPQLVVYSPDDASPASRRVRQVEARQGGWLAVEAQEGEVSTVLPSSPSIKRYLASARQADGNVGSISMRPTDEESRLDLVDLDDLRSTEIDPRLADATIHERNDVLDQSTIYPSSPAVRRNMMRMDGGDLMTRELSLLDPRLDRSVFRGPSGDRRPTSEMARATDSAVTRSPTKRNLALVQDAGDQTMDLGALIKKTSRKLTSDCADVTGFAPGVRTRGAKPAHDMSMSMLMDMQSPFKTREGVEESYYDLLAGDNTFMQQVEQVEAEDDSPVKGNVLPPAISTSRVTAPGNADDLVFKVPALPRHVAPATGSDGPEAPLNRIDGEPLPRMAMEKPVATQDFEFKVPELPRILPSKPPSSGSVRPGVSPNRESRQLPLSSARLASPDRLATRTTGATRTAPRTMFTPVARKVERERTPHKRNPSSEYRSTTLAPRTPLAERGYGPQSAKKASTSSLSGVLAETAGRSLNTRLTSAPGGTGIKRSATMNDFAPGESRDRDEKTPVRRHLRAPSDSIVRSRSSTQLDSQSRQTALSSAEITALVPPAGTTSRIRLPGEGLRQVSGQGKVNDADARSRKQATSPEKLLAAGKARVSLVPKPKSPPRQRTGFRPVASQQSALARVVDRPLVTAPGRQVTAPRQPVSRTGSSSSTILGRTSTIPSNSKISAATTRPLTGATGSTTRVSAPSATMPVKASNGLPRATSRVVPSGTAQTGSTTSVSSVSRLTRPSVSKDRQGSSSTVGTGLAPVRKTLAAGTPEDAIRSRLDRFKPTRK
ncbi:hypothetical protein NliqN6_5131 [Naganishia liquefaciens]|uniref:Uncharacterized protein n=1 Tax=Naganishia liquefaciens TaxID=104408 RepID=A0A8H3TYW3_9TREE|nr:hypothetical protein NliqN6_5131 [Naganishia liquefaciens]